MKERTYAEKKDWLLANYATPCELGALLIMRILKHLGGATPPKKAIDLLSELICYNKDRIIMAEIVVDQLWDLNDLWIEGMME